MGLSKEQIYEGSTKMNLSSHDDYDYDYSFYDDYCCYDYGYRYCYCCSYHCYYDHYDGDYVSDSYAYSYS